MSTQAWNVLLVKYVRVGSISVLSILLGLIRIIQVHRVGAVTILNFPVLCWGPFPREESV